MFNIVVIVGLLVTVVSVVPVLLQLRRHPRGLTVLFFVEMWERFSYYGMRGLLIFYLTEHFLLSDADAAAQYGAYTSLAYLAPLVGGIVADRYLGARKAIGFGALLLVAGHFLIAAEGPAARQYLVYGGHNYELVAHGRAGARVVRLEVDGSLHDITRGPSGDLAIADLPDGAALPPRLGRGQYSTAETRDTGSSASFYLALSLIIVGVGFLKPNISTMVGHLYEPGDPRRDPGFTLYYYGINLGSFWAAVLCGLLGQSVGWWAGFGLAGVGMLIGYGVFVWRGDLLKGRGEPRDLALLQKPALGPLSRERGIYLAGVVGVGVVWVLVQRNAVVGWMLAIASIFILGFLTWFMQTRCTRVERDRLFVALLLVAGAVVFFTLFEQAGSSLNLFAARHVDLPNAGFLTIVPAQVQSFNAGFLLLLAPIFAAFWTFLGRLGRDPGPLVKFGAGLIQVGLGFLVLVWGAGLADADWRVPLVLLALCYLLHTTAELCLSPVGLSEITKLAPAALASTLMAIWFLANSWGTWVGSVVAQAAGTNTLAGQVVDPQASLSAVLGIFQMLGWGGIAFGVVYLAISPVLKGWRHQDRSGALLASAEPARAP